MRAVHGGVFWDHVDGDIDRLTEIIRADVMDAWFPPAPGVMSALSRNLTTICNTSPEVGSASLRRKIAEWRGVDQDCVQVGPGASALIYDALPPLLANCRSALTLDPTYSEYPYLIHERMQVPLEKMPVGDVSLDRSADAVVVVNPNNPTGTVLTRDWMEGMKEKAKLLWIDETYIEYSKAESMEEMAAETPGVVVVKSLGKTLALSGLRVAYLIAHPETLKESNTPWPVSLPAQVAVRAAMEDPWYYANRYSDTRGLRADLATSIHASETNINCVLLQTDPEAKIADRLGERGVFVREFGKGLLRISVRPRPESWKLVKAMHEVLPSA